MKRNTDSAKRARTLTALSYSLLGGVIGVLCGLYGADQGRWGLVLGVVVGFLGGFLIVFLVATLAAEGVGTLADVFLNPSGKSTPFKREYSYPESLAARGRYEDAITAYAVCCAEDPDDPEPYVRIARLYRDELGQYDEAVVWFKRARSESALSSSRELLITREIIEMYTLKIGDSRRAIPELARLVDRFPNDPVSRWAKEEIVRLRQEPEAETCGRRGEKAKGREGEGD